MISNLKPIFGPAMTIDDGANLRPSIPADSVSTNVIPETPISSGEASTNVIDTQLPFDKPVVLDDNPGGTRPIEIQEGSGSSLVDLATSTGGSSEIVVDDKPFDWHDVQDQNYSLSKLMEDNPGLTPEQYLEFMSKHSDEWAEKYLDYLYEKEGIKEANEWTAQREDTVYQRLVGDLRKAGLNPAMMFGGSASVQASNSAGVAGLNSGANSRVTTNSMKIKKLILECILADWMIRHQKTQELQDSFKVGASLADAILGFF